MAAYHIKGNRIQYIALYVIRWLSQTEILTYDMAVSQVILTCSDHGKPNASIKIKTRHESEFQMCIYKQYTSLIMSKIYIVQW